MKRMSNNKLMIAFVILPLLVAANFAFVVPRAFAAARIFIVPAVTEDPSIAPGSTFKVNASATDIVDLFTWQVQLEYDPAVLNCTGASIPAGSIFNFAITPPATIDNTVGFAVLGSSKLYPPGTSGSDVLATFVFNVVGRGYSRLNFSRPLGADTFLLDSSQRDIPLTVEDGHFDNRLPIVQHQLTIQVDGSGTTNPVSGNYIYDEGLKVSVTAFPAAGWMLGHWELDTVNVGDANPYEVTMNVNHTLTAVFVELPSNHDIAVLNVTTSKNGCFPIPTIGSNYTTNVTLTIENQGSFTETYNITLYADSIIIATFENVTLTSGSSTTIVYVWNTTGLAYGNYTISAYASPVAGEEEIEDNNFVGGWIMILIPGDVVGPPDIVGPPEGKVDMRDVGALCSKFGAGLGTTQYNPNFDIDDDGLINMRDIGIACANFGKHYP